MIVHPIETDNMCNKKGYNLADVAFLLMKRFFLFTLAAVLCQLAMMAQPAAEFKETTYDFGTIKESKGAVKHTFEFKNTGDKPLIIVDAVASCGCTRPTYTAKPIKPGKKGKIEVTFSPVGRAGTLKAKSASSMGVFWPYCI